MTMLKELGRLGQKRYGGFFHEEFLKDLQGKKGIAVYQEMSENDDTIGAILFSIEMLLRQAAWDVQPGGTTPADEEARDFVLSCMDDMSDTWSDTISEILSFLTYRMERTRDRLQAQVRKAKRPATPKQVHRRLDRLAEAPYPKPRHALRMAIR